MIFSRFDIIFVLLLQDYSFQLAFVDIANFLDVLAFMSPST